MPAAVVAAGVGAVASVGGAAIAAKSQKKAANQATQAAADNTAANNALTREIYGENKAALAPYVQAGNNATGAIGALLGIGGAPQAAPANTQPTQTLPAPQQGVLAGGNFRTPFNLSGGNMAWQGEPANDLMYATGQSYGYNPTDSFVQTTAAPAAPTGATAAAMTPQQQYEQAFERYKASTGYQSRLSEGIRALDSSAASRGVLQSGAAMRSLNRYGQEFASNEFGNYLGQLAGQQQIGLAGASAQAGVSQNMVNNVTANNNSAASAAANAALVKGNANAQLWGTVGNSVGNVLGRAFG